MKFSIRPECRRAFNVFELFVLVTVFAIGSAVLLPVLWRPHVCCRINCSNNLKQIGLAFTTWALDNGDQFPMAVSTNDGGTKELSAGGKPFAHFAVMSNELSTPKVLVCPNDTNRRCATNFTSDLDNKKLSYFVGLDATSTNATMLLSGDRNLTNSCRQTNGILVLRPGDAPGWTHKLHKRQGNFLFADGSVLEVSNKMIIAVFLGPYTNRLSMP